MATSVRTLLRRTTALFLAMAVAAVVGLAVYRARQMRAPVRNGTTPGMDTRGETEKGDTVGVYEEFEHKETVAGDPVFLLQSVRTLGLASGWHEIEGVRLQLYNEGRPEALLTCDSASFNVQTRDARLNGAVHLQLGDGGFLDTEQGRFDSAGRQFVTDAPALFSVEGHVGRAGRSRYVIPGDRQVLDEQALIRFANGGSLSAPTVVYRRKQDRVELPDGVRLEHQGSRIEAEHAYLEMDADDGRVNKIVFHGWVKVLSHGPVGELQGWAERLSVERDAAERWQIRASTTGPWVAFELRGAEDFYLRSMKTSALQGVAGPEGLVGLRAEGVVCLYELPVEGPERHAESRRARVWFTDGQPTDIELERNVVLHGEGMSASGARARMSSAAGLVMLHADPAGRERATLRSERGLVQADQVQLFESSNRAEARGNVQGQLADVALLGEQPESGSEPLHFAAEVLVVAENGTSFHLRGNARAWQGRRLLLADEVRYRQAGETLEAIGHVRTTLPASQLDEAAAEGQDVVVVARSLDYGRDARQALYRGNVTYSDGEHMLSATQMSVHFDESDHITEFEAVGAVEMVDILTGRRMTGQNARRETASQIIELSGSPVQLTDANGNVVSGSSLTWDRASGRVAISGGPESPTETIYYPEDPQVEQLELEKLH